MKQGLRVGVLMGGVSSEREVSLRSGAAVLGALAQIGVESIPLDVTERDAVPQIIAAARLECVFIALHGSFGEDGGVQRVLEELRVPYTGSGVRASELAMDKVASRRLFVAAGIPVPTCQVLYRALTSEHSVALGAPLVVKPAREGSSVGLSMVRQRSELAAALHKAFSFDEAILVEAYIPGREITVGILNDKPLPVVEVVPGNGWYDYESKYTPGKTVYKVPADFAPEIIARAQSLALRAHQCLGCRCFSRVDMIVDEQGVPVVLEVNTIPGLTQTSLLPKAAAAAGISFSELCRGMIAAGLRQCAPMNIRDICAARVPV